MGGSGLGLAIVKHALNRHDGRLEISSVEGRGSTFTCHFPASRVLAREP
jgi:two-component system phosphate regulon sensor histidine kinase PhoR